mgnify:CR=1 FL=1
MKKFNLKSGNNPTFQNMGSSPVKEKKVFLSSAGTGLSLSGDPKKPSTTLNVKPGIQIGKVRLGGVLSQKYKLGDFSKGKTFVGGSGKLSLTGHRRGKRDYDPGFMGSLSGRGGVRTDIGKKAASGRLSLGFGRPGSWEVPEKSACGPGMYCGANTDIPAWNVKAFGEHGTKHSLKKGTRFGLSGRFGWLKGEGSYNIKTKKPEYKLGLNIPFNK